MPTIQDLRRTLRQRHATWNVNPTLFDDEEMPLFQTGGAEEGLVRSGEVERIDFEAVAKRWIPNPFLLERRLELGLRPDLEVPEERLRERPSHLEEGEAPPLGGVATAVDWRSRWGWPWITTVRDQNGCNACWAFAAVALVESMVRIEHCVWAQRL